MPAVSIEHVPDRSTSAPRQGTNRMLRPAYIKPNWRTTDPPVSGELDSQSVVRARLVGRLLTMSPPSLFCHHPSDFYRPLSHPCGGHLASVCTLAVAFRAVSSLPGLLSFPPTPAQPRLPQPSSPPKSPPGPQPCKRQLTQDGTLKTVSRDRRWLAGRLCNPWFLSNSYHFPQSHI